MKKYTIYILCLNNGTIFHRGVVHVHSIDHICREQLAAEVGYTLY